MECQEFSANIGKSWIVLAICISVVIGCAPASEKRVVVPVVKEARVVSVPAEVPEGIVRYCWEEPMVKAERNAPGLDVEGHWYSPGYVAVREVRQGRWRPCEEVRSKTYGRYDR